MLDVAEPWQSCLTAVGHCSYKMKDTLLGGNPSFGIRYLRIPGVPDSSIPKSESLCFGFLKRRYLQIIYVHNFIGFSIVHNVNDVNHSFRVPDGNLHVYKQMCRMLNRFSQLQNHPSPCLRTWERKFEPGRCSGFIAPCRTPTCWHQGHQGVGMEQRCDFERNLIQDNYQCIYLMLHLHGIC